MAMNSLDKESSIGSWVMTLTQGSWAKDPFVQGRVQEAIACYEHVSLLQAESPEAHANLASAYKDAGRQDTAIISYRKALQLRPDFPEAFANLVHSLQCVCEWKDRPQLFQRMENEARIHNLEHFPFLLASGMAGTL